MQIDKNTQAAFYFYSEMVKDSCGSRPRGADADWFVSLTEAINSLQSINPSPIAD